MFWSTIEEYLVILVMLTKYILKDKFVLNLEIFEVETLVIVHFLWQNLVKLDFTLVFLLLSCMLSTQKNCKSCIMALIQPYRSCHNLEDKTLWNFLPTMFSPQVLSFEGARFDHPNLWPVLNQGQVTLLFCGRHITTRHRYRNCARQRDLGLPGKMLLMYRSQAILD